MRRPAIALRSALPQGAPPADTAIPILPARDLAATRAFYVRLGFGQVGPMWTEGGGYLILANAGVELHFFGLPTLDPGSSTFGCYVPVVDARARWRMWSHLGLPADGLPRLSALVVRPWGAVEFDLFDPNGNLIRVGSQSGDS